MEGKNPANQQEESKGDIVVEIAKILVKKLISKKFV
jgi:hypothetical protein